MVGGVLAETVENIQDEEGGGEAGERILEEDEPQEVTLKDIHDLLSEHVPQLAGIARRLWDDRQPA